MPQGAVTATIRRMMAAGRSGRAGEVSVAKTFRLALAKSGQEALRLRLDVEEVQEHGLTLGELSRVLPERGLIVALHRRSGTPGIAVLDRAFVASVLEARTAGRATGAPVPDRTPTQTDAVLARGFLEAFLADIDLRMADVGGFDWVCGYSPREYVPDAERLPYMLADVPYRTVTSAIAVSGGIRAVRIVLVLPDPGAQPLSSLHKAPSAPDESATLSWQTGLTERVVQSHAALEVVLATLDLSICELQNMDAGTLLTLPRSALGRVTLVAPDGSHVARGTLGQSEGRRAVRIPLTADHGLSDSGGACQAAHLAVPPTDCTPSAT